MLFCVLGLIYVLFIASGYTCSITNNENSNEFAK